MNHNTAQMPLASMSTSLAPADDRARAGLSRLAPIEAGHDWAWRALRSHKTSARRRQQHICLARPARLSDAASTFEIAGQGDEADGGRCQTVHMPWVHSEVVSNWVVPSGKGQREKAAALGDVSAASISILLVCHQGLTRRRCECALETHRARSSVVIGLRVLLYADEN